LLLAVVIGSDIMASRGALQKALLAPCVVAQLVGAFIGALVHRGLDA
jgi:glycerol uptake facilitator-like aquaporin